MKKYAVSWNEIVSYSTIVEADSLEEARVKASEEDAPQPMNVEWEDSPSEWNCEEVNETNS